MFFVDCFFLFYYGTVRQHAACSYLRLSLCSGKELSITNCAPKEGAQANPSNTVGGAVGTVHLGRIIMRWSSAPKLCSCLTHLERAEKRHSSTALLSIIKLSLLYCGFKVPTISVLPPRKAELSGAFGVLFRPICWQSQKNPYNASDDIRAVD